MHTATGFADATSCSSLKLGRTAPRCRDDDARQAGLKTRLPRPLGRAGRGRVAGWPVSWPTNRQESGEAQIFVTPFPDVNSGAGRYQHRRISPHGSYDGKELFYERMVTGQDVSELYAHRRGRPALLQRGNPVRLFHIHGILAHPPATWDVSRDGNTVITISRAKRNSSAGASDRRPSFVSSSIGSRS